MITVDIEKLEVFLLEDLIWLTTNPVGVPNYDFSFERFFACRRPWQRPELIETISRFGVVENYEEIYDSLLKEGIQLIHTPKQYLMASQLTGWYPLLKDITPYSVWFSVPPTVKEVENLLEWPIFIKGNRQTSKHREALSIVNSSAEYQKVIEFYNNDPILHWQDIVLREFIPLRKVVAPKTEKISPSFEFRTFWWKGHCVGFGAYWAAFVSYSWTKEEERQALALAQKAANRLDLPFVVIDLAQTVEGEWIIIECNDAQESGYTGISPISLWQKIVDIERSKLINK